MAGVGGGVGDSSWKRGGVSGKIGRRIWGMLEENGGGVVLRGGGGRGQEEEEGRRRKGLFKDVNEMDAERDRATRRTRGDPPIPVNSGQPFWRSSKVREGAK